MRTFRCSCGETLFFDNSQCVTCGSEVGYCPVCRGLTSLRRNPDGGYSCGNPACGATLAKCHNYHVEQVCNFCIDATSAQFIAETLCLCCRYNDTIPDLAKPDNREKWRRLEAAKRRVFYQLELLGLPHGKTTDGFDPPLSFDFKEDLASASAPGTTGVLDDGGQGEVVMTGHLNGKITINIREADPVERERLRVRFGEPNRSLVGHFRHELAHYYWDLLIKGRYEPQFNTVFGNPYDVSYSACLSHYYQHGPPHDWHLRFASAYASMHPWEDFAETFTAYLEMVGTLDTAFHMGLGGPGVYVDFDQMIAAYQKLGVAMNEMNRTMGIKDHLARPIVPPVIEKMRFVHQLVRGTQPYATPG